MSIMDDVPSHWISKASIAKRIGISRVTVDKQLARIEKDKELSGRLNVIIVDEGKRKLYFYDPSDVDAVFSELQKKSRRKSSGVKRTNSRVNDNVKLLDNEIVKLELQKEELRRIALEKEVARLEDNLKDLRGENTFLKAQLTDQRPKVVPTSPELIKEEVVPPKPSTIAEIKEAVADAGKSNVGLTDVAPEEQPESPSPVKPTSETDYTDPYQPDTSIIEEEKRIYFEKTGKDIPPIRTQKDYDEYRKIVGSDYEIMHGLDQRYLNDGDQLSKAKDAEPEAQPELPPEEDTQPTEEAPKEKEARRDNIAPKAEPQQVQKKGFWNWLKGY